MCIRMLLEGKVALVTGGAQGLGKAFSEELLKNKAKVRTRPVDRDDHLIIVQAGERFIE